MDTDLIDRDGGDKDNTVLDRTCSDYKDKSVLDGTSGDDETLVQEGTSDREGSWLGKFPTGTDAMAGSHTWSGFSSGMDFAAGSVCMSVAGSLVLRWALTLYPRCAWSLVMALRW